MSHGLVEKTGTANLQQVCLYQRNYRTKPSLWIQQVQIFTYMCVYIYVYGFVYTYMYTQTCTHTCIYREITKGKISLNNTNLSEISHL